MSEKCDTHKKQHRTVNGTLLALLSAGFLLMFWNLATKGPSVQTPELMKAGFFTQFLGELHYIVLGSHGLWAEIGDVYLYFIFGIMLAGYIRTYKMHIRLRKTLTKYGFWGIVLASVIGVFSPLCSCGILATVIGLLSGGLPLAPAMALLISSPLMSPTAFFLTISDLGVEWTVVRVSSAFLMGMLAGIVTHLLRNKGFQTDTLFIDDTIAEGDFHDADFGDERLKCKCREKFSNRMTRKIKKHEQDWIREWPNFWIFWCKTLEMTWMIGKYVLVGIFVGSIAENYIPKEFLNEFFGKSGMGNVVWVTLGSIPIFLHQISASAILKSIKASVPGTLNPGAGLAFLIGGPVTAIPAMTLLWAMFKKRVFVLYMVISVVGTIFLSYAYNALVFADFVDSSNPILENVSYLPNGKASVITRELGYFDVGAANGHEEGETGEEHQNHLIHEKEQEEAQRFIQIAANPAENNLIAVYDNYISAETGVVFDAGFTRISNKNKDSAEAQKYLGNIANWLSSTSGAENKNILIYNTFIAKGHPNSEFQEAISPALKAAGFSPEFVERKEVPEITADLLENYSQIWIISGEGQTSNITRKEVDAVHDFHDLDSNAIAIFAGPNEGTGNDFTRDANRFSRKYKLSFKGTVENKPVFNVSIYHTFFENITKPLYVFYRYMKHIRDTYLP